MCLHSYLSAATTKPPSRCEPAPPGTHQKIDSSCAPRNRLTSHTEINASLSGYVLSRRGGFPSLAFNNPELVRLRSLKSSRSGRSKADATGGEPKGRAYKTDDACRAGIR